MKNDRYFLFLCAAIIAGLLASVSHASGGNAGQAVTVQQAAAR
jgi:hypothetical protein